MGLDILQADASFRDNAVKWDAAVPTGLVGAWFFGGTLARSLRNYAGGADATVVGAPVVNPNSLVLATASNYIQTAIPDAGEGTILVVTKAAAEQRSFAVSNLGSPRGGGSGTTNGISLTAEAGVAGNGKVQPTIYRATWDGTVANINTKNANAGEAMPVGSFRAIAARWSTVAASVKVDDKTGATNGTATWSQPQADLGGMLRIGSDYSTAAGAAGATETIVVLAYNRYINDADLDLAYQQIKSYCARRGISI